MLNALRITGSRSLAKMSGYDFVITIALGSLIATILLQSRWARGKDEETAEEIAART